MCACGKKKQVNGTVNHFSTDEQARIARERGVGVTTTAASKQRPAAAAASN